MKNPFPVKRLYFLLLITILTFVFLLIHVYHFKNERYIKQEKDNRILILRYQLKLALESMFDALLMLKVSNNENYFEKYKNIQNEISTELIKNSEYMKTKGMGLQMVHEDLSQLNVTIMRMLYQSSVKDFLLFSESATEKIMHQFDSCMMVQNENHLVNRFFHLSQQILLHTEARITLVNMAAYQWDPFFYEEHQRYTQLIDDALAESTSLLNDAEIQSILLPRIKSANVVLVNWELMAFDHIEKKQTEQAKRIFEYETYIRHKSIYLNSIGELAKSLKSRYFASIEKENFNLITFSLIILFGVLMVAIEWFLMFKLIRNWKRKLEESLAAQKEQEKVIVNINQSLEKVVNQRGLDLLNTIKEKNDLENRVSQMQKLESVGTLTGGIAHDFNNMLTIINGYGEILISSINKLSKEETLEYLNKILNAGSRSANLIKQLMAFSRQQIMQVERVLINDELCEIKKMLSLIIGEDINLQLKLDSNTSHVDIDKTQFNQVIINLCVNARDAMPDGGEITIYTKNINVSEGFVYKEVIYGDYVEIGVKDAGTGMSLDVQQKIFDPFFTTKEMGKGTGLGLSTVYGIIKQSNGYVYVESELGMGSLFRILLPKSLNKRNSDIVEVFDNANLENESLEEYSILIVEDEKDLRNLMHQFLSQSSYMIFEAENGLEGFEKVLDLNGNVDLIVSDVVMPTMKGPAMVQKIWEKYPDIPILFISGYSQNLLDIDKDTNFYYMEKPLYKDLFLEKINHILINHSKVEF